MVVSGRVVRPKIVPGPSGVTSSGLYSLRVVPWPSESSIRVASRLQVRAKSLGEFQGLMVNEDYAMVVARECWVLSCIAQRNFRH